ncbi:MAG: hypothetical protein NTW51_16785 [Cyanobacteria bacterium]|nr:hypothetical protein [Cyanobacteriota bacterium]
MTTISANVGHIIDALIAGLGVARQGLSEQCEAALRALGGRAIPYLQTAAAASPRRRKRIEAIVAMIDECQDVNGDTGCFTYRALVLAAAAQDEQDNPKLIPALKQLGPTVVDTLAREAILNRKKPSVCLRVLRAIEQLGSTVCSIETQLDSVLLTTSKNAAVRELALKLFLFTWQGPRNLEAGVSV